MQAKMSYELDSSNPDLLLFGKAWVAPKGSNRMWPCFRLAWLLLWLIRIHLILALNEMRGCGFPLPKSRDFVLKLIILQDVNSLKNTEKGWLLFAWESNLVCWSVCVLFFPLSFKKIMLRRHIESFARSLLGFIALAFHLNEHFAPIRSQGDLMVSASKTHLWSWSHRESLGNIMLMTA